MKNGRDNWKPELKTRAFSTKVPYVINTKNRNVLRKIEIFKSTV